MLNFHSHVCAHIENIHGNFFAMTGRPTNFRLRVVFHLRLLFPLCGTFYFFTGYFIRFYVTKNYRNISIFSRVS
jgi:hypothetical protein